MSKNCFIRIQKQDLSHKKWLFVLSAFTNLCMILLVFLFLTQEETDEYIWMIYEKSKLDIALGRAREIVEYFDSNIYFFGGIVAIVGAMIVGMYSLKHLFWQKTQDTFGSLPITRKTQFTVIYLNGLYAFLFPFTVLMLITTIVAAVRWNVTMKTISPGELQTAIAAGKVAYQSVSQLLVRAGQAYVFITLMYLAVYHLVLLAAALSGNILNQIVMIGTIGILPTTLCYIWKLMCMSYFGTFTRSSLPRQYLFATSPLGNALLKMAGEKDMITNVMLVVWSILLFGLAMLAYVKRPSEWAEKGMEIKTIRIVVQVLSTTASGVCGWQAMRLMTTVLRRNNMQWVWSTLGMLIGGSICFCLVNMIFHMNPKAILYGKKWFGVSIAIATGLILIFVKDVFGYDTYLPKKEDIAYIAISNIYTGFEPEGKEKEILDSMRLTDIDTVYEYLTHMVENQKIKKNAFYTESGVDFGSADWFDEKVKVTLKNGKSYYRNYNTRYEDKDVRTKLLSNPEYYDVTLVPKVNQMMAGAEWMNITRMGNAEAANAYISTYGLEMNQNKEAIKKILKALLLDLWEHPQELWNEEKLLLCNVEVIGSSDGWDDGFHTYYDYYSEYYGNGRLAFDIREGMTYTISALREIGYGEMVETQDPKKIESITFTEVINSTYMDYDYMIDRMGNRAEAENYQLPEGDSEKYSISYETDERSGDEYVKIIITDPEEIAELSKMMQYTDINWLMGYVKDSYEMVDCQIGEKIQQRYFLDGAIPNKYMKRILLAMGM